MCTYKNGQSSDYYRETRILIPETYRGTLWQTLTNTSYGKSTDRSWINCAYFILKLKCYTWCTLYFIYLERETSAMKGCPFLKAACLFVHFQSHTWMWHTVFIISFIKPHLVSHVWPPLFFGQASKQSGDSTPLNKLLVINLETNQ